MNTFAQILYETEQLDAYCDVEESLFQVEYEDLVANSTYIQSLLADHFTHEGFNVVSKSVETKLSKVISTNRRAVIRARLYAMIFEGLIGDKGGL